MPRICERSWETTISCYLHHDCNSCFGESPEYPEFPDTLTIWKEKIDAWTQEKRDTFLKYIIEVHADAIAAPTHMEVSRRNNAQDVVDALHKMISHVESERAWNEAEDYHKRPFPSPQCMWLYTYIDRWLPDNCDPFNIKNTMDDWLKTIAIWPQKERDLFVNFTKVTMLFT